MSLAPGLHTEHGRSACLLCLHVLGQPQCLKAEAALTCVRVNAKQWNGRG
jgi:hypothetical protein